MLIASLVTATVSAVWVFRLPGVHPAWVDANTLPIVAFGSILELADGEMFTIRACEVEVAVDKYPVLALELERCERDALTFKYESGQSVVAVQLLEISAILPLEIARVEESDPLGEGSVSQFRLVGVSGEAILFRHIMPPMTLGIAAQGAERIGPYGAA